MSQPVTGIAAGFDTQRSGSPTGSYAALGAAFTNNPVILIFDNQTDNDVNVSFDGTNTWKTFSEAEALVLDLRGNHGTASTFTIPLQTQIYIQGSGTGNFLVSAIYARG